MPKKAAKPAPAKTAKAKPSAPAAVDATSPSRGMGPHEAGNATGASRLPGKAGGPPASAARPAPSACIRVRGACEHNLKKVDVDIPRDRLVVITGLSGSGKSSLAFDTIFAEGQRKYMESLSAYARQFLEQQKKPDVESIEGLPPTIAIEQRTTSATPRSTVATTTEIFDYLRLLFARAGVPTCWHPTRVGKDGAALERCGRPITASSPSSIAERVAALPEGTRLLVLAPVVRAKKGHHAEVFEDLVRQGFVRARVNGQVVDISEALGHIPADPKRTPSALREGGDLESPAARSSPAAARKTPARTSQEKSADPLKLGRYEKHTIEAVVDRIVVRPDARTRLAESVETALKLGGGSVVVATEEGGQWTDALYSDRLSCPDHPECALPEMEPRLFSFNAPMGACPKCDGLGTLMEFDPELCIPDPARSLEEGAVAVWAKNGPWSGWFKRKYLRPFARRHGLSMTAPVSTFSAAQKHALLHGDDAFEGVIPQVMDWWKTTETDSVKEYLTGFMSSTPCPACHGDRLKPEALSVRLACRCAPPPQVAEARRRHGLAAGGAELNIADLTRLPVAEALALADQLDLSKEGRAIAAPILREVKARLGFLASVGLGYLALDRRTNTLSGGEAQRIRLATQVGSGLVGACYVLDEPTIGLHQRDNGRLIATLRHLADIGNSVLVVEHDQEMIEAADHILDLGPGAGVHGGRVVAEGTLTDILAHPESLTGRYLSGRLSIETPARRRPLSPRRALTVRGARENNLKGIDAVFPLGGLLCVTGVSGSGKSTLVTDILLAAARREVMGARVKPGAHDAVAGLAQVQRVIEVDQTPIGRTPRSNPATYVGFFDEIRKLFTALPESKARGYEPGRFSFNVKGGRCEACEGQGVKTIAMHFLPDVQVECEVCHGARYNRETLEIRWKGRTIADILRMTVEEACQFFDAQEKIRRCVRCLHDVGLDYLRLGQPATELSGGEAQRIKLATELSQPAQGHTLYVLDEPTTGLHFEDVRKLMAVLQRLADAGHTLVVIEHNLDVIKGADWIVDLGPEGGAGGGRIIASGPPEAVAANPASHTGRYLAKVLGA